LGDAITGGAGNDIIIGGAGSDTITGGTGADTIQYATWGDIFSGATNYKDVITDFHASQGDRIDLSAILGSTDSLSDTISIDGHGIAASSSTLSVSHGGTTWAVAVAAGQEAGIPDLMWNATSGVSSTTALHGATSWTDIIDVTGASANNSGPSGVSAATGASITNSTADTAGDWTIQIKSGSAQMDAANKQITFTTPHTSNEVVITDAAGHTHDITNVDKITWHG
jgi:hypothetical protein